MQAGVGAGKALWLSLALALGLNLEELRLPAAGTSDTNCWYDKPDIKSHPVDSLLSTAHPYRAVYSFAVVMTVSHLFHLHPR